MRWPSNILRREWTVWFCLLTEAMGMTHVVKQHIYYLVSLHISDGSSGTICSALSIINFYSNFLHIRSFSTLYFLHESLLHYALVKVWDTILYYSINTNVPLNNNRIWTIRLYPLSTLKRCGVNFCYQLPSSVVQLVQESKDYFRG